MFHLAEKYEMLPKFLFQYRFGTGICPIKFGEVNCIPIYHIKKCLRFPACINVTDYTSFCSPLLAVLGYL